jgi:hypothetical protein
MNFTFATTKRLIENESKKSLSSSVLRCTDRDSNQAGLKYYTAHHGDCGCVVDYTDGFVDDREHVLQWDGCGDHHQIGLLSSNTDLNDNATLRELTAERMSRK